MASGIFLFCSCGGGDLTATDVNGTWLLSFTTCSGTKLTFSGITLTVVFTDGSGTQTATTSGCEATGDFSYTIKGNKVLAGTTSLVCTPDPCTLSFTLGGQPVSATCPDDLSTAGTELTINGKVGTLVDGPCIDTYLKQ